MTTIQKLLGSVFMAAALAFAATPSLASEATGQAVLYNPGGAKLGEVLITAFNKHHPKVQVDVINAGVGELFTRIKAERNRPRGDVLMGASIEAYQSDADLFEPYKTTEDAAYPRSVIGPNNLYYGFDLLLQTFIVNTKLMPADQAPKSWKDLGEPRYKGKVTFANPSLSGSAYGQFAQILQLYGWDVATKVVQNSVVVASSQLVYQNVGKGESAVGITGDNNVVTQAAAGAPVIAIYPGEGTALRFSANALIEGAPNPQNAKLLLDFLNSKEAHTISVGLVSRRSARPDVVAPVGQVPTADIKTFDYDDAAAAAKRDENLKKFDEVLSKK